MQMPARGIGAVLINRIMSGIDVIHVYLRENLNVKTDISNTLSDFMIFKLISIFDLPLILSAS